MARQTCLKRQVRSFYTKQVAYVAVIVVSLNHQVAGDFSLHAEMKVASVRRPQPRIEGNRQQENSRHRKVHSEVAKASPKEKPRLTANGCAGSVRELLRIQSRQGLHVIQS